MQIRALQRFTDEVGEDIQIVEQITVATAPSSPRGTWFRIAEVSEFSNLDRREIVLEEAAARIIEAGATTAHIEVAAK